MSDITKNHDQILIDSENAEKESVGEYKSMHPDPLMRATFC